MTSLTTSQPPYVALQGNDAAVNYQRYFVPAIGGRFGSDLVDNAGLEPGERVLDVACGTGYIARLAAERVAGTGMVAGLDINPAMLSVARSIPAALPIQWYETTAEAIPLPDRSFDVAFCNLSLQFISDKSATLDELHRVLVPGGRVYLSTPIPNAFFEVLHKAVARHVSAEAGAFLADVFSLHDAQELGTLLTAAGFGDVDVHPYRKSLDLPPARDFMWQYISCTPLLAMLPQSADARMQALEDEVVEGWQPWTTDKGVRYEQAVLFGRARALG